MMFLKRLFESFERTCLPVGWAARRQLRGIDQLYRRRLTEARTDDEKRELYENRAWQAATIDDELKGYQSQHLVRKARRYHIVPPPIPWGKRLPLGDEDKSWIRGWASDEWYLRPEAFSLLLGEVDEAKARRRAVWESWVKILGGLITGLVALGSVIVSLILALRRP